MDNALAFAGIFLAGALIGSAVAWFLLRERIASAVWRARAELDPHVATLTERLNGADLRAAALEKELASRHIELEQLRGTLSNALSHQSALETQLKHEQRAAAEKLAVIDQAKQNLADAFKALSADALKANNQNFLELAKSKLEMFQESARGDLDKKQQAIADLVKPVQETLVKFDGKVQSLEVSRVQAYERLTQQVEGLLSAQKDLQAQTGNLVQALRAPSVRGQWGELQLRRVIEFAGMLEYCDFQQQETIETEDGRRRPDVIVKLPGGRQILIDSKAPMQAYLDSLEATDENERRARLQDHARQLKNHIFGLSRKGYWRECENTPEFVVLFLPAESLFSAALQVEPGLIQADEKVVLATPTTLIAVLRAVAHGWKEVKLAKHAQEISDLGRELYRRISTVAAHWTKLGRSLSSAVESYNDAVGSLENRVLPSARKFKELHVVSENLEIEKLLPLDERPRQLETPELKAPEFSIPERESSNANVEAQVLTLRPE